MTLRSGGQFVEDLLREALPLAHLSAADRRLCQELIYGVVRWQSTLDCLVARKAPGRTQKAGLQNLLRLGLYQLFWLDRIPDHAAVYETVALARSHGFAPQSGFVNAVLRGFLREADATRQLLSEWKITQPHLGYSHPEWLVARWQRRWGAEKTAQMLAWNNTPPPTYARVNTLKVQPGDLLAQWRGENVSYDFVRRDWLEDNLVFELKSHPPLDQLPSFQQGGFYVQDPSTLLAVRALDPQPGETVLDLCAAPGGKLTYVAQLMGNQGWVQAQDLDVERLKLVEQNCARLGVTCVEMLGPGIGAPVSGALAGSGRSNAEAGGWPTVPTSSSPALPAPVFDKVLLDAPCSNTGVMRRRVDLRWRLRPEEIQRLGRVRLGLLEQAAASLKPGGTLVYSTCSFEPEENREVVNEFLSTHPNFTLNHERELWPFVEQVDGAYVAKLTSNQFQPG